MSRVVDQSKPMSDDDKAYFSQFSWGKDVIEENEATHGGSKAKASKDSGAQSFDPEVVEKVKGLSIDEVKEALSNAGDSTDGNEKELRARLANRLQAAK